MNTAWKTAAAVIALTVCALFLAVVWPTAYRSIPVAGRDPRIIAAREHRFSGRVDILTRSGWTTIPRDSSGVQRLRAMGVESAAP